MTDETEPTTETAEAANRPTDDRPREPTGEHREPNGGPGESAADGGNGTVERLTTVLNYAVLGGLLLLAVVSAVQLYLAVSRTITTFVVAEYRAPVLAAFNLVVLLGAALGISVQLRRLSASGPGD